MVAKVTFHKSRVNERIASYGDNYKMRRSDLIPLVGLYGYASRNTQLDPRVKTRENLLSMYNLTLLGAALFHKEIYTSLEALLR